LEQAAAERGQLPEQVVRSILFRLTADQFVMALVAGPGQLSWPALRQRLDTSRITMATPEEVQRVTGYVPGTVAPFVASAIPGQPLPIRVLVDDSLTCQEEVSLGSGQRGLAVILKVNDLLHALGNPETGCFHT
jgi:prolyl-tRNA editing enzyme YbaK/EbsC (Cys-tRNA(Pro) deacylase)